jgi:hypothetical protein
MVIKSRRITWEANLASWGKYEVHKGFCLENLKGKDNSEDLSVDGKTEWILGK